MVPLCTPRGAPRRCAAPPLAPPRPCSPRAPPARRPPPGALPRRRRHAGRRAAPSPAGARSGYVTLRDASNTVLLSIASHRSPFRPVSVPLRILNRKVDTNLGKTADYPWPGSTVQRNPATAAQFSAHSARGAARGSTRGPGARSSARASPSTCAARCRAPLRP